MESMSEKWVPFRTDLILGKRKKSHGARLRKYGVCSKVAMFLQETYEYSGLCEKEHYCDGVPMRGLPKGPTSCYTLILQGTEKSLYRQFGLLLGLEVGIQNEQCLEFQRTQ